MLDTRVAYASIWQVRDALVLAGFIMLVLAAGAGLWVARTIIQPMEALILGAEQLADGHNDSPLPLARRDEVGRLAASFARMRDAVVTKHAELRHRTEISEEAARLKGEFLANMSHEVRTPINGVLGMTELLLGTALDGSQQRYASTIYRSGQSLLHVINDILDFSKIEAGKLQLDDSGFDLRQLVEDVVELLAETAHRKGLELTVGLAPDSHVAYRGDMHRLRQVLTNLISNAVKFTEHGQVSLEVSVVPIPEDPERAILHFAVTDTGIGISESAQVAVFESFVQEDGSTTRQYGGTGLGLAICASLAELLSRRSGSIEHGDVADTAGLPPAATAPLTGLIGHVLLAEDHPVNQEMMSEMLSLMGLDVTTADNGQEAFDALDESSFDVVLMDCQMPVLDGFSSTRAIRRREARRATSERQVIVALTANALQGDREACLAVGMDDYLSKPASRAELYRCLRQWISTDGGEVRQAGLLEISTEASTEEGLSEGSLEGPLDPVVFGALMEMASQAKADFLPRLIDSYIEGLVSDLEGIAGAIETKDLGAIGSFAHRLKSSSANFGALKLAATCQALESAARAGDLAPACDLLHDMRMEADEVEQVLRSPLAKAA